MKSFSPTRGARRAEVHTCKRPFTKQHALRFKPDLTVKPQKSVRKNGPRQVLIPEHAESLLRIIRFEVVCPTADVISVAGTFNNWSLTATPLRKSNPGEWSVDVHLEPGRYEYLYVVDGEWRVDPHASEVCLNPFGGLNSVLNVE